MASSGPFSSGLTPSSPPPISSPPLAPAQLAPTTAKKSKSPFHLLFKRARSLPSLRTSPSSPSFFAPHPRLPPTPPIPSTSPTLSTLSSPPIPARALSPSGDRNSKLGPQLVAVAVPHTMGGDSQTRGMDASIVLNGSDLSGAKEEDKENRGKAIERAQSGLGAAFLLEKIPGHVESPKELDEDLTARYDGFKMPNVEDASIHSTNYLASSIPLPPSPSTSHFSHASLPDHSFTSTSRSDDPDPESEPKEEANTSLGTTASDPESVFNLSSYPALDLPSFASSSSSSASQNKGSPSPNSEQADVSILSEGANSIVVNSSDDNSLSTSANDTSTTDPTTNSESQESSFDLSTEMRNINTLASLGLGLPLALGLGASAGVGLGLELVGMEDIARARAGGAEFSPEPTAADEETDPGEDSDVADPVFGAGVASPRTSKEKERRARGISSRRASRALPPAPFAAFEGHEEDGDVSFLSAASEARFRDEEGAEYDSEGDVEESEGDGRSFLQVGSGYGDFEGLLEFEDRFGERVARFVSPDNEPFTASPTSLTFAEGGGRQFYAGANVSTSSLIPLPPRANSNGNNSNHLVTNGSSPLSQATPRANSAPSYASSTPSYASATPIPTQNQQFTASPRASLLADDSILLFLNSPMSLPPPPLNANFTQTTLTDSPTISLSACSSSSRSASLASCQSESQAGDDGDTESVSSSNLGDGIDTLMSLSLSFPNFTNIANLHQALEFDRFGTGGVGGYGGASGTEPLFSGPPSATTSTFARCDSPSAPSTSASAIGGPSSSNSTAPSLRSTSPHPPRSSSRAGAVSANPYSLAPAFSPSVNTAFSVNRSTSPLPLPVSPSVNFAQPTVTLTTATGSPSPPTGNLASGSLAGSKNRLSSLNLNALFGGGLGAIKRRKSEAALDEIRRGSGAWDDLPTSPKAENQRDSKLLRPTLLKTSASALGLREGGGKVQFTGVNEAKGSSTAASNGGTALRNVKKRKSLLELFGVSIGGDRAAASASAAGKKEKEAVSGVKVAIEKTVIMEGEERKSTDGESSLAGKRGLRVDSLLPPQRPPYNGAPASAPATLTTFSTNVSRGSASFTDDDSLQRPSLSLSSASSRLEHSTPSLDAPSSTFTLASSTFPDTPPTISFDTFVREEEIRQGKREPIDRHLEMEGESYFSHPGSRHTNLGDDLPDFDGEGVTPTIHIVDQPSSLNRFGQRQLRSPPVFTPPTSELVSLTQFVQAQRDQNTPPVFPSADRDEGAMNVFDFVRKPLGATSSVFPTSSRKIDFSRNASSGSEGERRLAPEGDEDKENVRVASGSSGKRSPKEDPFEFDDRHSPIEPIDIVVYPVELPPSAIRPRPPPFTERGSLDSRSLRTVNSGASSGAGFSNLSRTNTSTTFTNEGTVDTEAELDSDDESDDEDADEEREDEDDVPLGTIPGALKMQKSLRIKNKRKGIIRNSDPFEFDLLPTTNGGPSSSSSKTATKPPPLPQRSHLDATRGKAKAGSPLLQGHSLLPHTDEAIVRRSDRAPSLPLDPLIALSTLTIDSNSPPSSSNHSTISSDGRRPSGSSARLNASPLVIDTSVARDGKKRQNGTIANDVDTVLSPKSPGSLGLLKMRLAQGAPPSPPLQPPPRMTPPLTTRPFTPPSTGSATATTSSAQTVASAPSMARAQTSPLPAGPTVERRIFIQDHTRHILVSVSQSTKCGEIVQGAGMRGALVFGNDAEGGFALWEICRALGVERPMREYELLADVIKSWDQDSNILIIRRTPLWPVLSNHLRPQPQAPKGGWVQLETKKGKWSKRFIELKDGVVSQSKSDKPSKDGSQLCSLASFDVFFVAQHKVDTLKAPKPYVFALKSLLPPAHYEEVADYCYFVSVKTKEELFGWIKSITEARNGFVRQREQVMLSREQSLNSSTNHGSSADRPSTAGSNNSAPSPLINPDALRARCKSIRAPGPHLAAALAGTRLGGEAMAKIPSAPATAGASVIDTRPNAQVWSSMDDAERHQWLKDAERQARTGKNSLLAFTDDKESQSGLVRKQTGKK